MPRQITSTPTQFLSDYGGLSSKTFLTDPSEIDRVISQYLRAKLPGATASHYRYRIHGLEVVIYSFTVHRAVFVRLPDNATNEMIRKYEAAYNKARETNAQDYELFQHNCVTTVAQILHCLHEGINEKVWFPYYQFSGLERLPEVQLESQSPILQQDQQTRDLIVDFLLQYKAQKRTPFKAHWEKYSIHSLYELYEHAMGMHGDSGRRTRDTLLSMGWVAQEEKTNVLVPTEFTPNVLKQTIDAMLSFTLIKYLSSQYKAQNGGLKSHFELFHLQSDLLAVLTDLCERARANPRGASYRTLKKLFDDCNEGSMLTTCLLLDNVDTFVDLVINTREPFLVITPRQFIFMVHSGVRDFSRVAIHHQASGYMVAIQQELQQLSLKKITLNQNIIDSLKDHLNFSFCHLQGIRFSDCDINGVDFTGAKLSCVIFDHVTFNAAIFEGAELTDCEFIDCTINQTTFNDGELVNTEFMRCQLDECLFLRNALRGVVFIECSIARCDFSESCVSRHPVSTVVYDICHLSRVNFDGVAFANFAFSRSELDGISLEAVEFSGWRNISHCSVKNTICDWLVIGVGRRFKEVQLSEAFFSYLDAHCQDWLPDRQPALSAPAPTRFSWLSDTVVGFFRSQPESSSLYPELARRLTEFSAANTNGDRFIQVWLTVLGSQERLNHFFQRVADYVALRAQQAPRL